MRVAVNVEQLLYRSPGGIGRYTAKLVTLLPGLDPDLEVVSFTARHDNEELEAAWHRFGLTGVVPPVVLPLPRPVLYDAWHVLGRPSLAWRQPSLATADIVHAPSLAVPPRGKAALVVTVHDVAPLLYPETFPLRGRWFHRMGLRAAKRAEVVITVSEAAKAELIGHAVVAPERIRVIPNGVDMAPASDAEVEAVRRRHGLSGRPYILWVGSLEPRKDVGTLLAAVDELRFRGRGRRLEPQLVLVGYAGWQNSDALPARARARLGADLRLLGSVDEAELRALYAGAAVFGFPSRHEGFGLPVLEAMSQGTPVVCSDIAALAEVTAGAARLVPPGDIGAWADALAEVLDDHQVRSALIEAGQRRAAERTWARTVAETYGVYRQLMA